MIAVLPGLATACRSTQLYDAFSLPPTNHFQNGAVLVSSVVCHGSSQLSRSAYSLKQPGKRSSLNRSKMAGSLALACATNPGGGGEISSSRQCTAIWASETCASEPCATEPCGSLLSVIVLSSRRKITTGERRAGPPSLPRAGRRTRRNHAARRRPPPGG